MARKSFSVLFFIKKAKLLKNGAKTTFSEIQGRPTFRKCKFNRQLRDFILENGTEAYEIGRAHV